MKGLIVEDKNCILNALIPFKKFTYFPPNIVTLKNKNPHNERENGILTVPSPSHNR